MILPGLSEKDIISLIPGKTLDDEKHMTRKYSIINFSTLLINHPDL